MFDSATSVAASPREGTSIPGVVDPFAATDLLLPHQDLAKLLSVEGAGAFNLAEQFDKQFKTKARELRTHGFNATSAYSWEEISYQVLFFALVVCLWMYRRRKVRKTPLAVIQVKLQEIQTELQTYSHEDQVIATVIRELYDFCESADISPVLQNSDKVQRWQLALKLVCQINLRLPRHPMRPSSYLAALQQLVMLLESLQSSRVAETRQYHRRGA